VHFNSFNVLDGLANVICSQGRIYTHFWFRTFRNAYF
jgi:hypothetical protein